MKAASCVVRCVHGTIALMATPLSADLPRTIWMLWFQGWDKVPEVVQSCRKSWELYNPTWTVRAISRQDIPTILGSDFAEYDSLSEDMPPAMESDLLRLEILRRHGGVWADATMLCRRPLDDWLPQDVAADGFFAFSPEEYMPLMSSFLAAEPGNLIITSWMQHMLEVFNRRSPADSGYFIFHFSFGDLILDDGGNETIKELWAKMPHLTASYGEPGPHFFVPYQQTLPIPCTEKLRNATDNDHQTPMWKLTHYQVNFTETSEDSCYRTVVNATLRQAAEYSSHKSSFLSRALIRSGLH